MIRWIILPPFPRSNVGAASSSAAHSSRHRTHRQPFELQAEEVTVEGASTPDYPAAEKAPHAGISAHDDAPAPAHEHLPGRVPRPQPRCLCHSPVLPGARLRLCPYAAHHRLRLRGRRRDVPGHDAGPQQRHLLRRTARSTTRRTFSTSRRT